MKQKSISSELQPLILTEKDRKILHELFINARASCAHIGKRVRLSKEVVNYRIKRLEHNFIAGYNTIIDVGRLGFQTFLLSIQLTGIDEQREKSIIPSLQNHPNVAWLIRTIGTYDLIIKLFAKSYPDVNRIIKDIESTLAPNLARSAISYVSEENAVPLGYLFGTGHLLYQTKEQPPTVPIDHTDLLLLKNLANNAREPITSLARKINLSHELVTYRIKRLEKHGVILLYRPSLWAGSQRLGYNWYLLSMSMAKTTRSLSQTLGTFLVNHPNVTYFYKTIGNNDLHVEIRVKTTAELSKILMDLRSLLKNVLKSHELSLILHEHKFTYFPECLS